MKLRIVLPLALAAVLTAGTAAAESDGEFSADSGIQRFDKKWEVHYSVFNSTFLTAKNAAPVGIIRAGNRGVLTIALHRLGEKKSVPASAQVTGIYRDLIHSNALRFQEVREEKAIYYLAGFRFSHRDPLRFHIEIKPEGASVPLLLKFRRRLYIEGR